MKEKRDNYFDNLRGFLIICVIVGNSLEYIAPIHVNPHYLILSLYMFHMPLFTFISGYFCKKSSRTTQAKVVDTLKIYLFSQILYFLFNKFIMQQSINFHLFYPSWTLWYLLALSVWYIISDYIKNYKRAIIISSILSLLAGFDGSIGAYGSISRILFFLPFFIAGMAFNKDLFIQKCKKYTIPLGISSLLVFIIVFIFRQITDVGLLFEYSDYTFYSEHAIYPFIVRLFHYIGGFIICYFLLLKSTSKTTIFTWIGKNTLPLYILQAAVIQSLEKIPYQILRYNSWMQLVISELIILISIITLLLIYIMVKKLILAYKKNNSIEITKSV